MSYTIAIVGATGSVGREMLNVLAEREFPAAEVVALASARSVGEDVTFGDQTLTVAALDDYDFAGVDIALFAAGGGVAAEHAPRAALAGAVVIDNSSHFRMDPDVPLIVPEVNATAVEGYRARNLIANPNCSTAQLVVALNPLHRAATIRRVVVATYQSVSGAGKAAMNELFDQTRGIFAGSQAVPAAFTKQIAFNVIPHIDVFMDDGSTKEEWKMAAETNKILSADIRLTATCVRVPVFIGHAEAVNIEFERPLSAEAAREILRTAPGVMVVDEHADGGYTTPVDCVGDAATFVSRIREDPTIGNGLNLWVVSDNLRKGAALNAVQIAEVLVNRHLARAA